MTPTDVRRGLVDVLKLDLAGPENGADLTKRDRSVIDNLG
jgi:hypothetical protein